MSTGGLTEFNAVLFADLGDSTRLYERLGDARAHEIANACLSRLEEVVAAYEGRTVKHIGDEVMCVFPDPNSAVVAAREMQKSVTNPAGEPELTVHIGLHWGRVLREGGDVFGDAVNLAARIAGLAHSRQILTTGATVEMLAQDIRASTRWIDRRHVKGKKEDVDVFEVIWDRSDLTEIKRPTHPTVTKLEISMGTIEICADLDKPAITIGRGEENDLVIPSRVVSRRHAKVEWRAGKWVLSDHSTNGTIVAPKLGATVFVHNEQVVLPDSGQLGMGDPAHPESTIPLCFKQVSATD